MDSNNEYCNRWFWQDYPITVPNTEYLSHATITADLRITYTKQTNQPHEHKEDKH